MTGRIIATAPGKVVLSGEYAVLDGAPAVAMAVTRRSCVEIKALGGDVYHVNSPGYSELQGEFTVDEEGLHWTREGATFSLVNAVWNSAAPQLDGACDITLDSRAFLSATTGDKTGLGSSAALVVALCAALRNTTDVSAVAHRAHVEWQGGVGSGIDIACSLNGGLLEYRREGSRAVPLRWPAGLCFKMLWSGQPASTRDKLGILNASTRKPSRVRLVAAAEAVAEKWRTADASAVIAQYRDYMEQLRAFSDDHGLGVFDAGHEALVEKAAATEVVYKPCGAGGGDVGIVLATDMAAVDEFVAANAADYSILDVALDEEGVRLE
jgi:phosphomevalonate kinase